MGEYEDFKAMRAKLNLTNQDIADITGLSVHSVKRSAGRKNFNRYLKLALWVYEKTKL